MATMGTLTALPHATGSWFISLCTSGVTALRNRRLSEAYLSPLSWIYLPASGYLDTTGNELSGEAVDPEMHETSWSLPGDGHFRRLADAGSTVSRFINYHIR